MTTQSLSIDWETRSECDITKEGTYKYADHPSTGIYMLGYAFNDEEPDIWVWGDVFPKRIIDHVKAGYDVKAFNAEFELEIWNRVLVPVYKHIPQLSINQIKCTAAQGRANSLPASLDNQARALNAPIGKSAEGKRLIREYSVKNVPWDDIPKHDQDLFLLYCMDDVRVERMVSSACRELSDEEWDDYRNVVRMNQRGIHVDIKFCEAAVKLSNDIRDDANAELEQITGGKVKKYTDRKARDELLLPLLNPEQLEVITTQEGKPSFSKYHRDLLLELEDLDPLVRRYLELIDAAGGSTVAKYQAMLRSHIDSYIYGVFMFNTATTGRASSKLVQFQNMKRPIYDDDTALDMIEDIIAGHTPKNPADTLGYLIRPTIYEDEGMTVMDYSSVEYVVLSWLAGNAKALDDYRNDVDAYKVLGANIFHHSSDTSLVTKDERQAAKVVILAAGFGGGKGAVQSMGKAYGTDFTDMEAQKLIEGYRRTHKDEVNLWHSYKDAAMKAVAQPFSEHQAGYCLFESDGYNLWVRLPSGRYLRYLEPKRELVETPWGEEVLAITYKDTKRVPSYSSRVQWPRSTLNHIILTENITQAVANDLLRFAMRLCEQEGLETFMMVHDELAVLGNHVEKLQRIMETTPDWAQGMPLKADGGFRYMYGK